MKAIILAGGRGERLRPLTDTIPKPMVPIKDKPLIEWGIENLKRNDIKDIILSIGYKAEIIQDFFKDGKNLGVNISYNIETKPLGTGGAVKDIVKKNNIKEEFALIWGDNLADFDLKEMLTLFKKEKADLVMSLTPREDVENFGVARLKHNKIVGFVEKPKREEAPSNLINAGAFIVNPKILDMLPDGVSNIERECFQKISNEDGKVYAFQHKGYWFPTDTLEKYNKAKDEFDRL
jgi:NDP-sugar pyrophosphorylase family protein